MCRGECIRGQKGEALQTAGDGQGSVRRGKVALVTYGIDRWPGGVPPIKGGRKASRVPTALKTRKSLPRKVSVLRDTVRRAI